MPARGKCETGIHRFEPVKLAMGRKSFLIFAIRIRRSVRRTFSCNFRQRSQMEKELDRLCGGRRHLSEVFNFIGHALRGTDVCTVQK